MKRITALLIFIFVVVLFVFADSQQGRTEGNLSDSSFVIMGYYKGANSSSGGSTNSSITFKLYDYNSNNLNYLSQDTQGASVVNVSNSHLSNDGTAFSWTMTGSTTNTVTLKFTFSVLQAEMNGKFYRPTYTLKMTINPTKKSNSNGSEITNDLFYSNVTNKTQVVGGGTTTGTKASQSSEFTGGATIQYSGGKSNSGSNWNNTTWYRSGTCTLNISDYEQGVPGAYEYRCWIVTEITV